MKGKGRTAPNAPGAALVRLGALLAMAGLLGILPPPLAAPPSRPRATDQAPWWTLRVDMAVKGFYKLEERRRSYAGNYSFNIRWDGSMVKDDVDYRLFHHATELSNWTAEETPAGAAPGAVLVTNDFQDKPGFLFLYLLRVKTELRLDFCLEGFQVPQNPSSEQFMLVLPRTAESAASWELGGVDYDRGVTKGSNRVRFENYTIVLGPVEKKAHWTWKGQKTVLKQEETAFISQGHDVKLTLTITPRRER